MGEARELGGRDSGFELRSVGLLQKQRGDQGAEIGVAAAFAEAVERALYLADAAAQRRQRNGDGLLGVVVRVDAEGEGGMLRLHLGDDAVDLFRHGAAVGVAEHQPGRARFVRGLQAM